MSEVFHDEESAEEDNSDEGWDSKTETDLCACTETAATSTCDGNRAVLDGHVGGCAEDINGTRTGILRGDLDLKLACTGSFDSNLFGQRAVSRRGRAVQNFASKDRLQSKISGSDARDSEVEHLICLRVVEGRHRVGSCDELGD